VQLAEYFEDACCQLIRVVPPGSIIVHNVAGKQAEI
jgi:hypothetical protein